MAPAFYCALINALETKPPHNLSSFRIAAYVWSTHKLKTLLVTSFTATEQSPNHQIWLVLAQIDMRNSRGAAGLAIYMGTVGISPHLLLLTTLT